MTSLYNRIHNINQGITDWKTQTLDPLQKKITTTVLGEHVGGYVNAVNFGRDDVPPNVRQYLEKYKNNTIIKMVVDRTPLGTTFVAMNALSLGEIKERMKNTPYDKLYHLRVDITFNNNNVIALEKTSQIAIYPNPIVKQGGEQKVISRLPQGLTLSKLLEGSKRLLGDKFLTYDATNNNCQDFIISVLQGSGIGDKSDYDFVKQDTDLLFTDSTFDNGVKGVAKKLTDLGGTVDTVIHGAGVDGGEIQSILFKRPEWSLGRAEKWLKKNGYKYDVDVKVNHYRFRQTDTNYKHYITKKINRNIELIIGFKHLTDNKKHNKSIMPSKYMRPEVDSCSDSDSDSSSESDSEMKGSGIAREKDIIRKLNKLRSEIAEHHSVHGGKINIAKSFKKLGSTVKKGFTNEIADLKKETKDAEHYVDNKNGLARDLINYGIPAAVSGTAGLVGTVAGGPIGGMAGSAMGAYVGDKIANKVDSAAQVKGRGVVKKGRGRPRKIKTEPDEIHIDINSHNAKRDIEGMGMLDKLTLDDVEKLHKLEKEHNLRSGKKDETKIKVLKMEADRLKREVAQAAKDAKVMKARGRKHGRGVSRAVEIFGRTADAIYNSNPIEMKRKLSGLRTDTKDLRGDGLNSEPLKAMMPAVMPDAPKPVGMKKPLGDSEQVVAKKPRGAGFVKGSQEAKDHMAKIRAARKK